MTMKKAERHSVVDKNILFQDSVYLFSFKQSNCVRRHILSTCCFDLLIHFRGWCQRMATLDTSFRRPFKLYNGSLENAFICFLMWPPQHRKYNGNSNPMHFGRYEYHWANYFWPHKRWIPNFLCMCQSIPNRLTFRYSEVQYSKNVWVEESNTRLEIWRATWIAKLIKINVLLHQLSNLTFNLHYMCLNFA